MQLKIDVEVDHVVCVCLNSLWGKRNDSKLDQLIVSLTINLMATAIIIIITTTRTITAFLPTATKTFV